MLLSGGFLFADDSGTAMASDVFSLSFETDIPLAAAGAAMLAAELLIEPAGGDQQALEDINFIDSSLIFPYDQGLDSACDFIFAGSLLFPAVSLLGQDFGGMVETGVMFAETMLLTYSAKELVKNLVPRYRPYTYLSAAVDDDYMNSFPSGHTAMAFAVSGFSAYVFGELYPDSEWDDPGCCRGRMPPRRQPLCSGLFRETILFRMFAAGALLGTAAGIGCSATSPL